MYNRGASSLFVFVSVSIKIDVYICVSIYVREQQVKSAASFQCMSPHGKLFKCNLIIIEVFKLNSFLKNLVMERVSYAKIEYF